MSRPALHPDRTADTTTGLASLAGSIVSVVRNRIRALGFWSAIALPLAYVPVLASGVETTDGGLVVLALLVAHLAALLVGRGYSPD